MNPTILRISTIALLTFLGQAQAAGDITRGKEKAKSCQTCHNADGQGIGTMPSLAGAKEEDLAQALRDYRAEKRTNLIMKGEASTLSDDDIANIAAYYASLPKQN